MTHVKRFIFIKLILLVGAIILTGWLMLIEGSSMPAEESAIIIIDVRADMMTKDIATTIPNDFITRLDAAKKIITKIIAESPQRKFGLITYGSEIEYLIPPTADSGTLLQYVNSLLAQSGTVAKRSTGLISSLQDKNIIVLGNSNLPKSLVKNAQILPLSSYKNFDTKSLSTFQHSNISTVQTQWLIIILCLLTILSL